MDNDVRERRAVRRSFSFLALPVLVVAMLAAAAPVAWGASRPPTVTFAVPSVAGDTARFTYTVDHGRQTIARLSCKLGPVATPCGTPQPSSRRGSVTYRVVLRGLVVGGHTFFVRVKLADHQGALGSVGFKVAQCDSQNRRTGTQYYGTGANLQTAIGAASSGDTLDVWGNCVGNFTIGSTSGGALTLTLVGHATKAEQQATLNGNHSDTVLTVDSPEFSPGTMVTLRDMSIINGGSGGIINNPYATITLNGTSQVSNNHGIGITNNSIGTVTLGGTAQVNKNEGGGITSGLGATVTLDATSEVDDNTGGVGICNCDFAAKLTLNGAAQVDGNTASGVAGGGILNANGAEVTLNGTSQVDYNNATGDGGGINTEGLAGVNLNGASQVDDNYAGGNGGGLYNDGSTAGLTGSAQVDNNTAGNEGGGIYVTGGGSVSGTTSSNVTGNKPDNCLGLVC